MNKSIAALIDKLSLFYVEREWKRGKDYFDRRDIALYLKEEFLKDKELFYANNKLPKINQSLISSSDSYKVYDLSFKSPLPSPYPENNLVYGEYYKIKEKTDTMIILHGWRIKNFLFYHQACRRFIDFGLNSILLTLPYHLKRAPEDTVSGEYTVSSDIIRTMEAFRQSVIEVRSIVDFLKKRGVKKIGILGTSFGGWVGGMLAVVEPRINFAILIAPAANPERILLRSKIGKLLRKDYPEVKTLPQKFLRALRITNPTLFKPLIKKENILLIESLYDQIIPNFIVENLWRAWDKPPIRRYPQGHLSLLFFEKRLFKDIREFLKR